MRGFVRFQPRLPEDTTIKIYKITVKNRKDVESQRCCTIQKWLEGGGVLILSNSMFRMLANEHNIKIGSTSRNLFVRSLNELRTVIGYLRRKKFSEKGKDGFIQMYE